MAMKEVGNNYLIVVEKDGALDRLTVKVEVGQDIFMDDSRPLNALKDKIKENLQVSISIRPHVGKRLASGLGRQGGKGEGYKAERRVGAGLYPSHLPNSEPISPRSEIYLLSICPIQSNHHQSIRKAFYFLKYCCFPLYPRGSMP